MGFLSGLFKRKKGGTFVGNLIRGVANKATGGVLGNGADLAKWEAEQAQKEFDKQYQETKAKLAQNQAYNQGSTLGNQFNVMDANDPRVGATKKEAMKNFLKDNIAWVIGSFVAIIGLTLLTVKLIKR